MSKYYHVSDGAFEISTDPAKLDIALIHHYLSEHSYWAKGIPRETVEKSIEHSLCFGVYHQAAQVGLARVISDRATFAYLADVFILPEYHGRGLGKWLMKTIHAHPELQGLRRWMLATRDAHGLYEQFAWTRLDEEAAGRIMQIVRPNMYQQGRG